MEFNDHNTETVDTILTPGGIMPSDFPEINPYLRDSFYLFFVVLVVTLIGASLWKLGFNDATVLSVFFLGILGVSTVCKPKIFGFLACFFNFLLFIFLFTEPLYSLRLNDKGYLISFFIMGFTSVFVNHQMARVKDQIKKSANIAAQAEQERLRSTLLRSISHDLRTPLTAISGNVSILLDKSSVLDEAKKKLLYQSIHYDSLWLNSVIENILSITRIEDGKMRLNLQAELVSEVIDEALAHISVRTDRHIIRVHVVDEFLMAAIDLKLILQVIINLVENAIKYTPPGTEILITAKRVNQKVVVQIADNGTGVPDEKKEKIFDVFYSGSKSCGESRSGLGLGLACCKAILSAHEEDIYILDNIPQGTIFEFTLKAVEVNSFE